MKHLLTTIAIISLLVLTSCDDDNDKDKAVKSFTSVEECKAGIAPDATQDERDKVVADCQKAYDQARADHERTAPHYATLGECVDLYGAANCGLHGDYYQPVMNGFLLGYLAGSMTYQPYYYNRWGVAYNGTTNLGYYRSGYVYVPPASSAWTRSYPATPVARGSMAPPPVASTRGVFGGSAANSGHGISLSAPRPSVTGNTSVTSPPASSARGVFGASAAAHASSAGSGSGG